MFQGKATRFNATWPAFKNPFALLDVNNLMHNMDKLMDEVNLVGYPRVVKTVLFGSVQNVRP